MKKIHFDNMKNWVWVVILILSLLFVLNGIFEVFENSKLNKTIIVIGILLQSLYYSRLFWYKNYVQWNGKGATIRINSFWGKSLDFQKIKKAEFNNKKLIITKANGSKVTFDLNGILESDTQKLNEIIIKNTFANV